VVIWGGFHYHYPLPDIFDKLFAMLEGLSAVAFDLDGTLYPNYRFYYRLLPFLFRHGHLLTAFGKARNIIRREQKRQPSLVLPDFYDHQARLTVELLGIQGNITQEQMRERIDRLIYRGWESYFANIKLFPGVSDILTELRTAGLRMGMLSDFPPLVKLEELGLASFWDVILCSEDTGALKPAAKPFAELANALGCPPEQILYVGNSHRYDVIGAGQAGMKTAWIVSRPRYRQLLRSQGKSGADFIFHDYRQLRDFVLQ
jgi:putative hydrolase of the HAD superfamily